MNIAQPSATVTASPVPWSGNRGSATPLAGDGMGEPMAGSPQSAGRLAEVKFLTVAEVATLMRVSKMTVYRLVHDGQLTAVRVGRSFRVPEHAVHEYLHDAFAESA
jgi:excisionase family DNA binding protein